MVASLEAQHEIECIDDLLRGALFGRLTTGDQLQPLRLYLVDQLNIEVINARGILGDLFIFKDDFLGQRIARCQVEIAIICRRGKLGAELRPMHVTLFLRLLKEEVMRIAHGSRGLGKFQAERALASE